MVTLWVICNAIVYRVFRLDSALLSSQGLREQQAADRRLARTRQRQDFRNHQQVNFSLFTI